MKRTRFYNILIEKPGNPKEAFDPSEYLQEMVKRPKNCTGFAILKEGVSSPSTAIWVSASWNEVRYSETLFRYLRHVLWIFARACRQIIDDLYWKVATSGTGRRNK